jgi:beta-xylosidase
MSPNTKPINSTVNPIIPGFAPDPSLIRHNGRYWLVNSTFHMFPGLPIYSSTDLVHWTHHHNAISRLSQLSVLNSSADLIYARNPDAPNTKLCFQGGLYAPTLRYHAPSETFYLLCTNIVRQSASGVSEDGDSVTKSENFWVTCKDIEKGEWSDPVYFEFEGIDPSIWFEEEDGKPRAYVCGSRGPGPGTKINLFEVDLATGKKLSEEKTLWEGELKFYPEGPHVYHKGGWYWLLIAEGGTHEGHCINMARSRDLWGPYESNPDNPVVKAVPYGQDVQCTGHMDFVEDEDGQWWGTCLGIRRRGEKGVRMTHGRETFLTKVTWPETEDGWVEIEKIELQVAGKERKGNQVPQPDKEGLDLLYIREPNLDDYQVRGQSVKMKSSQADLDQWEAPVSFVGKRQRLMEARSEVSLAVKDVGQGLKAGLVVYKDEHRFVRLYLDGSKSKIMWQVLNKAKEVSDSKEEDSEVEAERVWLQIAYTEEKYVFSFKMKHDAEWNKITEMDHALMSGPDFVGPVIGPFATGQAGQEMNFENWLVDEE